jgi:hypothetical protein
MWMMTFLKMTADLGILLSAAGFFALQLGGHAAPLLLSLPVFALSFAFSFLLKDRGILRFLPLIAAGLLFLYPGLSLTDAVILLTELAYLIWLTVRQAYMPVWETQTEIFSVYWKVFLGVLILEWLGAPAETRAMTLPAGLTASACCILLNRSLRHEPSVYRTLRFQAVNLIGLAAVGFAALLLGSETFLNLVGTGLGWFYNTLIAPLLMGIIYLFIQLIKGIAWFFSFIKLKDPENKDVQDIKLDGLSPELDLIQGEEAVGIRFLNALLIIAAAAAAFFLLRALARSLRKAKQAGAVQAVTLRSGAEEAVPEPVAPRGPVRRIREIYRRFLHLCLRRKVAIARSDTSLDVQRKSEGLFEEEDSEALRRLYLKARYRETADEAEAEQARQLYRQLKKEEKTV